MKNEGVKLNGTHYLSLNTFHLSLRKSPILTGNPIIHGL
jgi:hypothetical protein